MTKSRFPSLTHLFIPWINYHPSAGSLHASSVLGFETELETGWEARKEDIWLEFLEVSASPVSLSPAIWPQSPHLNIQGSPERVPKLPAHTSISDF